MADCLTREDVNNVAADCDTELLAEYFEDVAKHPVYGLTPAGKTADFLRDDEIPDKTLVHFGRQRLSVADKQYRKCFIAIKTFGLDEERRRQAMLHLKGMWEVSLNFLLDPNLTTADEVGEYSRRVSEFADNCQKDMATKDSDQGFIPVKAKRQRTKLGNLIAVHNRFSPIQPDKMDTNDSPPSTSTAPAPTQPSADSGNDKAPNPDKDEKIDPFFVQLSAEWKKIHEALKKVAAKPLSARVTGDMVRVTVKDINDYRKVQEFLNTHKIPYHVLAPKNERPVKFLIKGLHEHVDLNEVVAELDLLGFKVTNINFLRNREENKNLRLLLVQIAPNPGWQDITRIETLYGMDVYVKKFSHKGIKQCYRCQGYNHASYGCTLPPRCVKCAGPHNSKECKKPPTEPPTCVNCQKAHPASYRGCEKNPENWKKLPPLRYNRPTRIDAPPPANPAWQTPTNLFGSQTNPPKNQQTQPQSWADRTFPPLPAQASQPNAGFEPASIAGTRTRTKAGFEPATVHGSRPATRINPNPLAGAGMQYAGFGEFFEIQNLMKNVFSHFNMEAIKSRLQSAQLRLAHTSDPMDKAYIFMQLMDVFGQQNAN